MTGDRKTRQLLVQMREFAQDHGVPIIRQDVEEWLGQFTAAAQAKNILEIGTAIGYSALVMALAAGEDGKVLSFERDDQRYAQAMEFIAQSPCRARIRLVCADIAAPGVLPAEHFDFVFLDGAKGQYMAILKLVLPYLQPGAVIVADNTAFRGWVEDTDAAIPRRYRTLVKRLREYRQWVFTGPEFSSEDLAIGDGVTITRYDGRSGSDA